MLAHSKFLIRYGVTKAEKVAYESQLDAYNKNMQEFANNSANKKDDADETATVADDSAAK